MLKTGIMLCGALGCTASTLAYGYYTGKDKATFRNGSMWCSIAGDYLPETYDLVFSGWDLQKSSLSEVTKKYSILQFTDYVDMDLFSPIIGPLDYAHRVSGLPVTHFTLKEAIEQVTKDIEVLKKKYSLDKVIVINLSSPMYCGNTLLDGWDSISAYSQGAVLSGADWIEFTPSNSINEDLLSLACGTGSRIAGRDGSTGQTIIKLLFKEFLINKKFSIDGWYSTNIIGNHDGEVLAHPDYNVEKLLDKKSVLNDVVQNKENHIVEISYYKPVGDNKESWDCVNFTGWLDAKMSLRLNWHGRDSLLAAALALDIITCMIKYEKMCSPFGLVKDLGICFKNPIPHIENSYSDQFRSFCKFVYL